tara:strand:+ start:1565 stop:1834 length:270 start_codon:yes stop_codon:yes gene_type:complete
MQKELDRKSKLSEYNKSYYQLHKRHVKEKGVKYYRNNKTVVTMKKHFKDSPSLLELKDLNVYIYNLRSDIENVHNNIKVEKKSISLNLS